MATDRITVNAGGRLFETTRATLLTSGAQYFQALLGRTGASLGTLDGDDTDANGDSSAAVSPVPGRGTKRSRGASDPDTFEADEVFVDRDPDLFGDVLEFMRSSRLPARARRDLSRLDDIKAEADFFIFDGLRSACDSALEGLRSAMEEALRPEPEPEAECKAVILEEGDRSKVINVSPGKVIFIASATLAGSCVVRRYNKTEKQKKDSPDNVSGCYINCAHDTTGDFQLLAQVNGQSISLAHVGLNHIHTAKETGLDVDFRQHLGLFLSGGRDNRVRLRSAGAGDWHVLYWIGDVEAIPTTGNRGLSESRKKRRRINAAAERSIGDTTISSSSIAAAMLALAAAMHM